MPRGEAFNLSNIEEMFGGNRALVRSAIERFNPRIARVLADLWAQVTPRAS